MKRVLEPRIGESTSLILPMIWDGDLKFHSASPSMHMEHFPTSFAWGSQPRHRRHARFLGGSPNSGLQYSHGVDYGILMWIYFFDPPKGLGMGSLVSLLSFCRNTREPLHNLAPPTPRHRLRELSNGMIRLHGMAEGSSHQPIVITTAISTNIVVLFINFLS